MENIELCQNSGITKWIGFSSWRDAMDRIQPYINNNDVVISSLPVLALHYSPHLKNLYQKKYKKQITNTSQPLSYDATIVMADAIDRANSLDRAKIRDALAKTKGFQGATGNITFDEYGDPLGKEVIILKLENGRRIYHKAIKP